MKYTDHQIFERLNSINASSDTILTNLTIRDDGNKERILFLDPNTMTKTVIPLGDFRTGYKLEIYNTGTVGTVIFDPNKLSDSISPGNCGIYAYDGTEWVATQINSMINFTPPVGSIIAYSPGYFTNGSNAGFTFRVVSANTVAAVNTLLNPSGWYVCNGAALNDTSSGIFNGAGRYLPNLTDDRFIMGDTVGGGIGGATTVDISHTHTTGDFTLTSTYIPSHTHTFTTGSDGAHTHTVGYYGDLGGYGGRITEGLNGPGTTVTSSSNGAHTHTGTTDATGSGTAHNHGATGSSGSATLENKPLYLSCFYIMRVH